MSIWRSTLGQAGRMQAKRIASAGVRRGAPAGRWAKAGIKTEFGRDLAMARRVASTRAGKSVIRGGKRTLIAGGAVGLGGGLIARNRNRQISGRQSIYEH